MKMLNAALCLFFMLDANSEDWNQWRGPNRTGEVIQNSAFPDSLKKPNLKQTWSAELAEGYSGPIISDGKVFTVETVNKTDEVARAFDLKTGKQIWEKKWQGSMKVPFFAAKHGSWVRATPACDDQAIYVCGMRDVLVKLDKNTGEEIWRIDFVEREGTELPSFGYISSPLIDGDSLYVQAGSAVAKIDKATGENQWRVLEDNRAMFGNAFSSPILAEIHGQKQLLVQNRMSLVGLETDTGKTVWETPVKAFRGMNILTPTVQNNQVFTASYGGGSFCFEIPADDPGKVKTLWNQEKMEGYMSTPLLIDGYVYLLGRDKKFYCFEMATGTKKWSSEESFGDYWSMIYNGNRVLALDGGGELILFEASPEKFKIADRVKISDQSTWAHIGYHNESIAIRSLKSIQVFSWSP